MRLSLRRATHVLRSSMAAQIGLAIALISVSLIAGSGYALDNLLGRSLREESELILLANLAFIRDDLAAAGFDVVRAAPELVNRTEQRVHRLHVAIFDEQRRIIARSPGFSVPMSDLPIAALDTEEMPPELTVMQIEGMRERFGELTSVWVASDHLDFRVLLGRIALPATKVAPVGSVLVALAIQTSEALELRVRDRRTMLVALTLAAVLAVLLGMWIAQRIVVVAKQLGTAASRISAHALHERLPLEATPVELIEATVAFNHMLDRLQRAFERLSAFSSDLAHDLRTPIGNLLGEAQVALSRPRSAIEYRAVLESAVEEYERLSRMIGNMLFLARADNDQANLASAWLEPRAALSRVIAYFEQIAEERGVTLQLEVLVAPGISGQIWADETMLVRAASNLISNALRHAARGSSCRHESMPGRAASSRCPTKASRSQRNTNSESSSDSFAAMRRAKARRPGQVWGWRSCVRSWHCMAAMPASGAHKANAQCSVWNSRRLVERRRPAAIL